MLAYYIKDILSIAPEALSLIKKANIEEDLPLDSKDSCAASYLAIQYRTKVAGEKIDLGQRMKIEKAAELYNLKESLTPIIKKFDEHIEHEKQAKLDAMYESTLEAKQSHIEGTLTGFPNIEKTAELAEALCEAYGDKVTSDVVKCYGGKGYLNKEAALGSLAARYEATKDASFLKVATILRNTEAVDYIGPDLIKLAKAVTILDNRNHLGASGFNFYREAIVKSAASMGLTVKLGKDQVPYAQIQKFGKERIGQVVGQDIAKELTGDPVGDKAVLESLPLDSQKLLQKFVKSC